jgi:hypothetical protein
LEMFSQNMIPKKGKLDNSRNWREWVARRDVKHIPEDAKT